jgi:hypothetical protein
MQWSAKSAGCQAVYRDDEHAVSFQPTALCLRSGLGKVFYVAGYVERTGQVVVEEWTANYYMGAGQPNSGGEPVTLLAPNVTREVLLSSDLVTPIRSMAYFFPSQRLWLFEDAAPHTVWSVDPETGNRQWLFDQTVIPEIALGLSAQTFMVTSDAPDGGGFIVVLFPWRDWDVKWMAGIPSNEHYYVFRDSNLDGTVDSALSMTVADYDNIKRYGEFIDAYYH